MSGAYVAAHTPLPVECSSSMDGPIRAAVLLAVTVSCVVCIAVLSARPRYLSPHDKRPVG